MKVALAVLLISLALIDARGAQASSSSTVEGTKEASATFDTQLDGIRNSVEISVAETDLTTAEGTERGLHANIEILQADSRRGDTRIVDVAGGGHAARRLSAKRRLVDCFAPRHDSCLRRETIA